MNLTVVGMGHIGLITALCFADKGHSVMCMDNNHNKISSLQKGPPSIYEPSLTAYLQASIKNNSIEFFSDISLSIINTDCINICVGTPNHPSGPADLEGLEQLLSDLTPRIPSATPIIIRSTVPPGTHRRLAKQYPQHRFISSPEFLREGSAIHDCLNPDRIIVGSDDPQDLEFFKQLYKDFNLRPEQFLFMDPTSAEMSKYAANIFLANRVSLINEFARISEKVGADIKQIQKALTMDPRIGGEFLNAGLGYGGSCFPKDLQAFTHFAKSLGAEALITDAVQKTNTLQIRSFTDKIIERLSQQRLPHHVTLWGLSFKPNTDDLREAPALKLAQALLEKGYSLKLYDPKATSNLQKIYSDHPNVTICSTAQNSAQNSSAIILCTEWSEFYEVNLKEIKPLMAHPIIFDGRNIYDPQTMKELGFEYHSVGRPS